MHLVGLFHIYSAYGLRLSATCSNSFLMNYFIQTTTKSKQQNIDVHVYFYKKHITRMWCMVGTPRAYKWLETTYVLYVLSSLYKIYNTS